MADIMSIIKGLFKVGICSTSDAESGTITATFPDKDNMVSDVISVVYRGGIGAGNGVPQPGDTVVCLFLGGGLSDGICLGVIYDDDDPPGEEGQQGIFFPDGSQVYFDTETGDLVVKAVGNAVIEAASASIKAPNITVEGITTITGNVTVNGNLSVTGTVSASNI